MIYIRTRRIIFVLRQRSLLFDIFDTKSVILKQRTFRREFPGRKVPCRKTITNIVEKFRNTGSVGNDNKSHSGRQVTVRTPKNVQGVREHLFEQSLRKSPPKCPLCYNHCFG